MTVGDDPDDDNDDEDAPASFATLILDLCLAPSNNKGQHGAKRLNSDGKQLLTLPRTVSLLI